jgi:integrase/recombinase XerD
MFGINSNKAENVDLDTGLIQLEAPETKTKKARLVPLSTKTITILKDYIKETEDFNSEVLFVTYDGMPLSDNTVRKNLQDWGKKANITSKRVSPHTFRHTGALFYVLNGGDPFSLQKILGHSNMSMVRKYIQMTDTDVKRQHNTFSPINVNFHIISPKKPSIFSNSPSILSVLLRSNVLTFLHIRRGSFL